MILEMLKHVDTVSVFGFPVSRMGMEETIGYLVEAAEAGETVQVVTINPVMIMEALEHPAYGEALKAGDLFVPDGAGVVWAAAKLDKPVAERVTGFDLLHGLMAEADQRGWRVYLLGAEPEVVAAAAARLGERYAGARIAGYRDGYFDDSEDEAVIREIARIRPHLLFVARSAARQDPWIARYRNQLNASIMMGVGGSFDVIAGKLRRAPVIWQRLRLEWLYRLIQEPWRYKRMLALPRFALRVMRMRKRGGNA
jgi:N-acetylglucosaminyldiphosphoundecaprenol N-acetyl-beta-D-mannosaminyltransferase